MLNSQQQQWTGNIQPEHYQNMDIILEQLCIAFNTSPFFSHNNMSMRVVDGQIEGYIDMQAHLIGNVEFQILHGGVAATMLDSMGGVVAMVELYKRGSPEHFNDTVKKVGRLATLDMRVDYLAPGRGQYFITRAEVLRMGRKSCVMRMNLVNDENVTIAVGIASYSY
ncbi:MAG: thioesterase family protein [Acinetobacter sp.]|jgi:uncharacterized protein (TIGR00369 family)|nr:MAG: thioesterase family protein [Acinetobacter sp.]